MENFTSDLLFIIIVLVGAAILGFLIGYFVNARYKKVMDSIDDLKEDMDKMKAQINDLVSFKEKHMSEYDSMKSDLASDKDSIRELQKLVPGIDELKKKIDDHSHESVGKELGAIKAKLSEMDERTAPPAFNPERAEKALGRKIKENDLTIIEGVGPIIAEILHKQKISTWQELAKTSPEALKAILLKEGGESYAMHNPASWPAQASMAWEGKWELLKEYQDYMVGGVSPEKG